MTGASGTAAGARRLHVAREEEEEAEEAEEQGAEEEAAVTKEDHRPARAAQRRRVTDVDSPTALHARARVNRRRKLLEKAPVPLTTNDGFIAKASGQVAPTKLPHTGFGRGRPNLPNPNPDPDPNRELSHTHAAMAICHMTWARPCPLCELCVRSNPQPSAQYVSTLWR